MAWPSKGSLVGLTAPQAGRPVIFLLEQGPQERVSRHAARVSCPPAAACQSLSSPRSPMPGLSSRPAFLTLRMPLPCSRSSPLPPAIAASSPAPAWSRPLASLKSRSVVLRRSRRSACMPRIALAESLAGLQRKSTSRFSLFIIRIYGKIQSIGRFSYFHITHSLY